MCFLESTRRDENEMESCSVNLLDISLTESISIETKSQNKEEDEEDPLIRVLEDALVKREGIISDQSTQIKELKTLVCSLMTQLSRLIDIEKQYVETKESLYEVEKELKEEKGKRNEIEGRMSNIKRMLNKEDDDLSKKRKETATPVRSIKNKRVKFEECDDRNSKSLHSVLGVPSVCEYHRVLGNCPMFSVGKCDQRHPRKICFQYREIGKCQWNDKCKFRHPLKYRIDTLQDLSIQQERRIWNPRTAPTTDWRRRDISIGPPPSSSLTSSSSAEGEKPGESVGVGCSRPRPRGRSEPFFRRKWRNWPGEKYYRL